MRTLKGIIISHRMQKTAVVRVDRLRKHSKYLKYERRSKKFKAHDEHDAYHAGDHVMIQDTRPLSKEKRWRVVSLIRRAPREEDEL